MPRRTVLPLPKRSQANPTRGSKSKDVVILYPFGVFGSVPIASPLFGSPTNVPSAFLTNVPTRLILVRSTVGVRGSKARRSAFAQATRVMALAQAGLYNKGALVGSKRLGSKFEPCPSIWASGV